MGAGWLGEWSFRPIHICTNCQILWIIFNSLCLCLVLVFYPVAPTLHKLKITDELQSHTALYKVKSFLLKSKHKMKLQGNVIPLFHGFIYEGVEVWIPSFFTSTLDGGNWSMSHASPSSPGRVPTIMNILEKKYLLLSARNRTTIPLLCSL